MHYETKEVNAFSRGHVGLIMSLAILGVSTQVFAETPSDAISHPIPIAAIHALTAHGAPMAHATVMLFGKPPQSGRGLPVAEARTNAQGNVYLMYTPAASIMHAARANNGQANFTVVVSIPHHSPDVYTLSQNLWGNPQVLATTAPAITLQPQGKTAPWMTDRKTLVALQTSSKNNLLSQSVQSPTPMHTVSPQAYCGYVQSIDGSTISWTKVGELHNSGDASARFSYGRTADSTIGVGYSTGSTGPWSLDGTAGVSNTNSVTETQHVPTGQWPNQGYQLLSKFSYERIYFQSACGDNVNFPPYYLVKPTAWDGSMITGQNVSTEPSPNSQYVDAQGPNTGFVRNSGTAFDYRNAFNAFGASLTAQSGFSTNVQEQWHFYNYTQYLWGNNGFPTVSSIIYAGNHA